MSLVVRTKFSPSPRRRMAIPQHRLCFWTWFGSSSRKICYVHYPRIIIRQVTEAVFILATPVNHCCLVNSFCQLRTEERVCSPERGYNSAWDSVINQQGGSASSAPNFSWRVGFIVCRSPSKASKRTLHSFPGCRGGHFASRRQNSSCSYILWSRPSNDTSQETSSFNTHYPLL